jgi:hypothetical protein
VTSTSAVHCDAAGAALCPLVTSGYLNIARGVPDGLPPLVK